MRKMMQYRDGGAVAPEALDVNPALEVNIDDAKAHAAADVATEHLLNAIEPPDAASKAFQAQIDALRQSEEIQRQKQQIQTFFQQNPDMIKNPHVLGAAEDEAVKAGHQPHSPQFYNDVKQRFENKMLAMTDHLHPLPPPKLESMPEASGPSFVSREVPLHLMERDVPSYNREDTPSRITLSPAQLDMARVLGQSPAEYARALIEMRQRDKEYGR